jgi:hypothetical protein
MHLPTPEPRDVLVTQAPIDTDLSAAIVAVYQAPLEEFISRRDALAKALRAEKRRDDAALVKALRKPSRIAWSLNAVVREDPRSLEHLAEAIRAAQTGVDLRAALEGVKEAVRAVAAAGARAAVRAGQPVEPNALTMAVHAIIGDASAFAEMRAGRLVDVPEGGGLDLLGALTALPAPPSPPPAQAKTPPKAAPVIEPPKPDPRIELAAAARAELHRAEQRLAEIREASEQAVESLRDAQSALDAAERAVEDARAEAEARRHNVERTRRRTESAAENLAEAQRAVDAAKARLAKLE